jgi:hypothetical protein
MSDIIYTPPASSGGTTINPSNNWIPARDNATTFRNSILIDAGDRIETLNPSTFNAFGFSADQSSKTFIAGDRFNSNFGTQFRIEDNNQRIITKYQNNDEGLRLDFATSVYYFGDYNGITNGTSLTIDNSNSLFRTYFNGIRKGLQLDNNNEQFSIGDFDAVTNGNYIIVDNSTNEEVVICANKQLNIKGANIQVNALYNYSNENLQVQAPDGNVYYIPLYKP